MGRSRVVIAPEVRWVPAQQVCGGHDGFAEAGAHRLDDLPNLQSRTGHRPKSLDCHSTARPGPYSEHRLCPIFLARRQTPTCPRILEFDARDNLLLLPDASMNHRPIRARPVGFSR